MAQEGTRIKGSRRGKFPKKLPYDIQVKRLGDKFEQSAKGIADIERGVDISVDPRAVVPERCLVFELIGQVPDFNLAAQALGLHWLRLDGPPEDHEEDESEDQAPPAELLYLTMPTLPALKKLLAQWNRYKKGEKPASEFKALWKIFDYLRDIRTWSVKDRIDPSVAKYVLALLAKDPNRMVTLEIDLWYMNEKQRRDKSIETLAELVQTSGGQWLDMVEIAEIQYQGALVSLPAAVAKRLVEGTDSIALLNEIMTVRPQSAYESPVTDEHTGSRLVELKQKPANKCIAVLLDGYPVASHSALKDRVHIRDVDVTAADVPAQSRFHGTAMASLVLHGDLHTPGPELDRPLAIIPVLSVNAEGLETTPPRKLPIGVIHRALKVVVQANDKTEPHLASAFVVNHSICDEFAPFARRPSPWAALLDFYSNQYRMLFLVSAGNIRSSMKVPAFQNDAEFLDADQGEREAELLLALERSKGTRGLLSPAEAINAITVGALHGDAGPDQQGIGIDPFPSVEMTNLASAVGLGANRSVKPDLVERGGRFVAGCSNIAGGGIEIHPVVAAHFGQLVAAPSAGALQVDRTLRTSGTSNATALATRACHWLADSLDQTFGVDSVDWTKLKTRAVMLKALLAHGCAWGPIGQVLHEAYPPEDSRRWNARRDNITRFLGFGRPSVDRVATGDGNRVTLLAQDLISSGSRHDYQIPIPASMIGNRDVRAVTLTLAWTCPTTNTSIDYRGVALKLCNSEGKSGLWQGVDRSKEYVQPNATTSERGTLQHVVLKGKTLIRELTEAQFTVCVQGIAKQGFEKQEVPYALAITLELAQSAKSTLYAEVQEAIRTRARVQPRATQQRT